MKPGKSEMRGRYQAGKKGLRVLADVVRFHEEFGDQVSGFGKGTLADAQRTYDKAAAKLEMWRKANGVAKTSKEGSARTKKPVRPRASAKKAAPKRKT